MPFCPKSVRYQSRLRRCLILRFAPKFYSFKGAGKANSFGLPTTVGTRLIEKFGRGG